MNKLYSIFAKLKNDRLGATAIEYGLIVSLIVIAMTAALKGVATENARMWTDIKSTSAAAISQSSP